MANMPTLRIKGVSSINGVLYVEFVPGPSGNVWVGEGNRVLGFCGLKALQQFVASCERAQARERAP